MLRTRVARQVTLARRRYQHATGGADHRQRPGVPEEIRERIFYPLVSGREGGTGLGLTLAQTFVAPAQRRDRVREPSPGTHAFTILLPVMMRRTERV